MVPGTNPIKITFNRRQ